jgi:hypothetical protein
LFERHAEASSGVRSVAGGGIGQDGSRLRRCA